LREDATICPRPLQVDLWSGVRVTCDVGYLCANFSLPRPLCSRLRPDVRDRQTDVRRTSSLNAPAMGRGITSDNENEKVLFTIQMVAQYTTKYIEKSILTKKSQFRIAKADCDNK